MKKKELNSKTPVELFNLTDLAESWGMGRGGSHKHHNKGNIVPEHSHYHGSEIFWETIPEKPRRKKK